MDYNTRYVDVRGKIEKGCRSEFGTPEYKPV